MSNKYDPPQTRVEAILLNMLGESYKLDPPQTRVELLLQAILEQGGGGGTEPVIKYKGVTTTPLTDGSTINPVEIDGEEVIVSTGDFVAYNGAEFIWNGTSWQELGDLELVAAIMTSIAPTYSESETYNIGDRVYYNDILYECLDNNVTGSFAPSKWTQISVVQILSEIETSVDQVSADTQSVMSMISDTYKTTNTYNIGDLVIRNKVLFSCTTNNTTGTWDASRWSETDIATVLKSIRSSIDSLITALANLIDDTSTASDKVWSSAKTDSEIIRTLSGLTDTEITSPTDKQILRYDNTSSKWINSDETSVTKSATGNPIEFTDGADAPLVKCVSAITGSQDLHGYDKPWVWGAGKNKLPLVLADIKARNTSGTWSGNNYTRNGVTFSVITDESENITGIKATGTATANTAIDLSVADVADNTQVILNGCPSDGSEASYYIGISTLGYKCVGSDVYYNNYNNFLIYCFVASGYAIPSGGVLFTPMVRIATVTDSTFAPYSNICPITAYTDGEIVERGKNLCPISEGDFLAVSTWVSLDNINANTFTNGTMLEVQAGTYTLSLSDVQNLNTLQILNASGATIVNTPSALVTFVLNSAETLYIRLRRNSDSANLVFKIQIEKGSSATTYEPYTSTTHTTTYPSAIYRGSEDVVKGSVECEWKKVVFDGTEAWRLSSSGAVNKIFELSISDLKGNDGAADRKNGIIASFIPLSSGTSIGSSMDDKSMLKNNGILYVRNTDCEDTTDFATWINGCEFAYELATPTTSPVTPTNLPIKSLSGYNHIESSTGEMEVEYITQGYQPLVDLITSSAQTYKEVTAQEYEDLPDSKNSDNVLYFVN